MICDAQVHAPAVPGRPARADPPVHWAGSIGRSDLAAEMANAGGVDRAVLVPVDGRIDECLSWVEEEPEKYAVVAPIAVAAGVISDGGGAGETVASLRAKGCRGIRLGCFLPEQESACFDRGDMDDVIGAAEEQGVPIMFLPCARLDKMATVAADNPGLDLCIDHMGITPRVKYDRFMDVDLLGVLLPLAAYPNVVVKLTQIVRAVDEPYPVSVVARSDSESSR